MHYEPKPFFMVDQKGSLLTARCEDGSPNTRNVSIFLLLPHESPEDHPVVDSEDTVEEGESKDEESMSPEPPFPLGSTIGTSPVTVVPEPMSSFYPKKPTRHLL